MGAVSSILQPSPPLLLPFHNATVTGVVSNGASGSVEGGGRAGGQRNIVHSVLTQLLLAAAVPTEVHEVDSWFDEPAAIVVVAVIPSNA